MFGYDNVDVLGPDGKRSYVVRKVNAADAAIVLRIFGMSKMSRSTDLDVEEPARIPPTNDLRLWAGQGVRLRPHGLRRDRLR